MTGIFFAGKRMKKIADFTVLRYRWLNYKTYILELQSPEDLPPIEAGNFAEVQISNSPKVFLRRPFSVYDVDYESRTLSFFVKIIGEGTRLMSEARPGDKMNLIYPLGNSFSVPEKKHVLIVGGGSGIAPFILLARKLKEQHNRITFLFGGRSADDIVLTDDFMKYGKVLIMTEDGSIGEKGLVTQHSIFSQAEFPYDSIACCGPEGMMKAVGKMASKKGIPCEASLENTMACGFGACLCCVVETVNGNKCVCTEGPVFNVNNLKWQTSV